MNEVQTSIFGFLPNPSMVDFPGHLSAVTFTAGCNFRCGFCHNAELMEDKGVGMTWERLGRACKSFRDNWVDGVVITGGEPTLANDLHELVVFFRRNGFAVKLDTNGSNPDAMQNLLPEVDYVAMDVKCSLPRYHELAHYAQSDRVQESVEILKQSDVPYELRTTLIESFHDDAEMESVFDLIAGVKKYALQPFLPRDDLPEPRFRNESRTDRKSVV